MQTDPIPSDADQPNVPHALTRKRADIAGQIEHRQRSLRHLIAQLGHVDAAIRILNPDFDIGAIRSKPVPSRHAAFKGEVTRIVLDILRDAARLVTSREIAVELMRQRALNPDDRELSEIMIKRVRACLTAQRRRGLIQSVPLEGNLQGWEVTS